MVIEHESAPLNSNIEFPRILKFIAHIISVVFHPLFIPLYSAWYITFVHPLFFTGMNDTVRYWILIRVSINMVLLQGVTVLLLKGVGFIDSIFLRSQRDRIIPYITAGIFYFWMYLVFHNQLFVPLILPAFVFGAFLATSAALIANIYFKVSMHAIGVGGLLGLLLVILFYTHSAIAVAAPLMITLLITGLVCTSRLMVSDHKQGDIYAGLFLGIVCQFIGAMWVL
jgi:hypothetical protein